MNTVRTAEFNPRIKQYILFFIAFFLGISIIGIPLLIIWFLGVGQIISKKYYESLSCHLTSHHLEYRKGVFFKVEKTIPLENIQDLTFIQNPILNLFDMKILKIETAGNSSSQSADMKLIGIVDAAEFKSAVLLQRENLKTGSSTSEINTNDSNESLTVLKEIRDLLHSLNNKN